MTRINRKAMESIESGKAIKIKKLSKTQARGQLTIFTSLKFEVREGHMHV